VAKLFERVAEFLKKPEASGLDDQEKAIFRFAVTGRPIPKKYEDLGKSDAFMDGVARFFLMYARIKDERVAEEKEVLAEFGKKIKEKQEKAKRRILKLQKRADEIAREEEVAEAA